MVYVNSSMAARISIGCQNSIIIASFTGRLENADTEFFQLIRDRHVLQSLKTAIVQSRAH